MINYPTKKANIHLKKANNLANRGMALEEMINRSNEYYKNNNIAYINKRPTPIKVIKTDGKYNITEGVFMAPSTLDYVGLYQGKYLDFDAKETASKTNFSFNNVAKHQFEAIDSVIKNKGIAFLLIYFKSFEEIYLLDGSYLLKNYHEGKKSLLYEEIKKYGKEVKKGYVIMLDYIKAVKEVYFEQK